MRIRLLMLITDLEVGGVPLHLLRLATALPRERFDVLVVSLADEGPVGRRLREAGIAVAACGAGHALDLRALGRLHGHIRRFRPDVIHALLFHANVAARLVGPAAGVPGRRIVCEIQTVERERPWHLWVDGLTCRLCRVEVGNSPSVVEHLHAAAYVPRSRLACVRGGVDVERIAGAPPVARAALGVPASEPIVLWTGRFDPVKGLDELIEAAAIVRRDRPIRLLLAGQGEHEIAVRTAIAQHGGAKFVHLLGRRDDVPALLATADVFAFPSHTEGLPNALMEAMAAGKAIVTTNVPGCRDLVTHERTGLLVPPGEARALAAALRRLLDDAPLRQRLGDAAAARAREQCRWDDVPPRWVALYEHVRETIGPDA